MLAGLAGLRPQHAGVPCRLLANLYNGTVYIWDYNDQVQGGICDLLTEAADGRAEMLRACMADCLTLNEHQLCVGADGGQDLRGYGSAR